MAYSFGFACLRRGVEEAGAREGNYNAVRYRTQVNIFDQHLCNYLLQDYCLFIG